MAESNAQMVTGSEGKATAGSALSIRTVSGTPAPSMEIHPAWPMISRMPATLEVSVPLRRFKVCDLLNLACGQTIESAWAETEDVPLKTGALQLCWGEFEVVEQNMALRLTRLA
jgi:flagellar motor switch protein FliN/FliY